MLNHVNKHPQIYNTQKPKQRYMLEQKQKEPKPSNVNHIKKPKKFGVPKHIHLVDDMIVYTGDKIHRNFQKFWTLLSAKI